MTRFRRSVTAAQGLLGAGILTRFNEAQQLMGAYADRVVDRPFSTAYVSTAYFCEFRLLGMPLHDCSVTPDEIAAVTTGLRVLTAISKNVNPALGDVEELLRRAPECSALPSDKLACEVVRRALKKRAAGGQ